MRSPRLKVKDADAVYHCMSRIVGGAPLLGETEKEMFRKMMWPLAQFCGVALVTHCVMSNHFHLLVEVPKPGPVTDEELVRRARLIYKPRDAFMKSIEEALKTTGQLPAKARQKLLARMGDISMYLKELKQRFSRWFNRQHDRFGTLWAERFESVLVEDQPENVLKVAAYIDLNPVRAGLVQDPKDYRFCGYASAVAADKEAQAGLAKFAKGSSWTEQHANYRMQLFGTAGVSGHSGKAALSGEQIRAEIQRGGKLPLCVLFRVRVRYMTRGAVLGSRIFVDEIFQKYRKHFGAKRQSGAREMKGGDWGGMTVLGALRREVFG